jgi:hypothetical protein
MRQKATLLSFALFVAVILACNLTTPTASQNDLDPTVMSILAGQTIQAVQTSAMQQTIAAGGTSGGGQPAVPSGPSGESPEAPAGATPTLTNPPPPPDATITPTPSQTPIPCNRAHFEADVTVPDNWTTLPNDHFTKTWRIRNIGTCTWTSGYTLVFDHGDQMGAPASSPITGATVPPGGTVDISVALTSPDHAGTFQGWYRLHASDNSIILFDNSVNNWFWLKIITVNPTFTPTHALVPIDPGLLPLLFPSITEVAGNVVHIPNGGTSYTKATCPAGRVVVGGGFSTGGGNIRLYNSHPHENGWEVFGKNNASPSDALGAFTECLSYGSVSTAYYWQSVSVNAFSSGHASVTCPAGTIMTGGGFDSGPSMRVYTSADFGNGWQVTAQNPTFVAGDIKAFVFCLSGTTGSSSVVSTHVAVGAHATGGTTVTCPSGKLSSGGGFALSDGLYIYANYRGGNNRTWNANAENVSAANSDMTVYGVCLSIP